MDKIFGISAVILFISLLALPIIGIASLWLTGEKELMGKIFCSDLIILVSAGFFAFISME